MAARLVERSKPTINQQPILFPNSENAPLDRGAIKSVNLTALSQKGSLGLFSAQVIDRIRHYVYTANGPITDNNVLDSVINHYTSDAVGISSVKRMLTEVNSDTTEAEGLTWAAHLLLPMVMRMRERYPNAEYASIPFHNLAELNNRVQQLQAPSFMTKATVAIPVIKKDRPNHYSENAVLLEQNKKNIDTINRFATTMDNIIFQEQLQGNAKQEILEHLFSTLTTQDGHNALNTLLSSIKQQTYNDVLRMDINTLTRVEQNVSGMIDQIEIQHTDFHGHNSMPIDIGTRTTYSLLLALERSIYTAIEKIQKLTEFGQATTEVAVVK